MSFEEMYFKKQLEAGKVDPNDVIEYYKSKCAELEKENAELKKRTINIDEDELNKLFRTLIV